MANPEVLNAAPLKKVSSRSPHPPKTDKFSKVDQVRKTETAVTESSIVDGANNSVRLAKDAACTLTGKIDANTGGLIISGDLKGVTDPTVLAKSVANMFTQDENGAITSSQPVDHDVEAQEPTSGFKSATGLG